MLGGEGILLLELFPCGQGYDIIRVQPDNNKIFKIFLAKLVVQGQSWELPT